MHVSIFYDDSYMYKTSETHGQRWYFQAIFMCQEHGFDNARQSIGIYLCAMEC